MAHSKRNDSAALAIAVELILSSFALAVSGIVGIFNSVSHNPNKEEACQKQLKSTDLRVVLNNQRSHQKERT